MNRVQKFDIHFGRFPTETQCNSI